MFFSGTITLKNRLSDESHDNLNLIRFFDYFQNDIGTRFGMGKPFPEIDVYAIGKNIDSFAGFVHEINEAIKGDSGILDIDIYYDEDLDDPQSGFGQLFLKDGMLMNHVGYRVYNGKGTPVIKVL